MAVGFIFSAYAGGMAARGSGGLIQIIGAVAGGIGIFLPGLLLIYFIFACRFYNIKQEAYYRIS